MKVIIQEGPEPYSKTGMAFRAYEPDKTPMYLGAETLEALKRRILDFYPGTEFVVEPACLGCGLHQRPCACTNFEERKLEGAPAILVTTN